MLSWLLSFGSVKLKFNPFFVKMVLSLNSCFDFFGLYLSVYSRIIISYFLGKNIQETISGLIRFKKSTE